MKKFSYVILGVSLFIFLISLVAFAVNLKAIQTEEIYASVNISDKTGFDVNDSALIFGSLVPGSNSVRNLYFENSYEFPVIVKTKVDGSITDLLNFKEIVRVEQGETKKLGFGVVTNKDVQYGFYDGVVEVSVLPG